MKINFLKLVYNRLLLIMSFFDILKMFVDAFEKDSSILKFILVFGYICGYILWERFFCRNVFGKYIYNIWFWFCWYNVLIVVGVVFIFLG